MISGFLTRNVQIPQQALLARQNMYAGEEPLRMAFLIADNRLTENSSWDERMLGEQLKILSNDARRMQDMAANLTDGSCGPVHLEVRLVAWLLTFETIPRIS